MCITVCLYCVYFSIVFSGIVSLKENSEAQNIIFVCPEVAHIVKNIPHLRY